MAFFFRKLDQPPQNILIARTDRIGDFVLTLPVFQAIKNACNSNLSVLCSKPVTPLLEENPNLDQTIVVDNFESKQALVEYIRSQNFDALIVMVNDKTILELLPDLHFIPVRIGPLGKIKAWRHYNYPVLQKRSKSVKNEAEYNLELLEAIGLDPETTRPLIPVSTKEKSDLKTRLEEMEIHSSHIQNGVILHAGMSGSALNWSDAHYRALLQRLIESGITVFLTGASEAEKEKNSWLMDSISDQAHQVYDLTSRLSLRELAVLTSIVRLFIGPSTGPTHVANAVGTKVISFYPPIQVQSVTRWQPYLAEGKIFSPQVECGQKYKCLGERCPYFYCMDLISPEEVFHEAMKYLRHT